MPGFSAWKQTLQFTGVQACSAVGMCKKEVRLGGTRGLKHCLLRSLRRALEEGLGVFPHCGFRVCGVGFRVGLFGVRVITLPRVVHGGLQD